MEISCNQLVAIIKNYSIGNYELCKIDFDDCRNGENKYSYNINFISFLKETTEDEENRLKFWYLELNFIEKKGFFEVCDFDYEKYLAHGNKKEFPFTLWQQEYDIGENLQLFFDQSDFFSSVRVDKK